MVCRISAVETEGKSNQRNEMGQFVNSVQGKQLILSLTAWKLSAKCNSAAGCQSSSGVEQRTHNSKTAVLAIFSRFLLSSDTIAKAFILLAILNVEVLSLGNSKNPKNFFWVTSRVQVLKFYWQKYTGFFLTEAPRLFKSECHGSDFERSHTFEKSPAPF